MDSVSDYYSATQLRSDRWSALREVTGELARASSNKISAAHRARAHELFESLALIEPYWAFPGMAAFDHMRRQLDHNSFDDLAFTVHRVTLALTTGAYRRRRIPLERDNFNTQEEHDDEALLSPEARALAKPYFEVLIVTG